MVNLRTRVGVMGNRRGASLVEYALLAALIAVASILLLGDVGKKVKDTFSDVKTKWGTAQSAQ